MSPSRITCAMQGAVVSNFAIELAIKKAKATGVAVVACSHSNHYGIAGYYALKAAKAGMVGFAMTNTSPFVVRDALRLFPPLPRPTISCLPPRSLSLLVHFDDSESPVADLLVLAPCLRILPCPLARMLCCSIYCLPNMRPLSLPPLPLSVMLPHQVPTRALPGPGTAIGTNALAVAASATDGDAFCMDMVSVCSQQTAVVLSVSLCARVDVDVECVVLCIPASYHCYHCSLYRYHCYSLLFIVRMWHCDVGNLGCCSRQSGSMPPQRRRGNVLNPRSSFTFIFRNKPPISVHNTYKSACMERILNTVSAYA